MCFCTSGFPPCVLVAPGLPRVLSGALPATNLANGAAGTRTTPLDRPQVAKAFDALYAGNERYGKVYQAGRKAHEEVMAAANSGMMSEMQAVEHAQSQNRSARDPGIVGSVKNFHFKLNFIPRCDFLKPRFS